MVLQTDLSAGEEATIPPPGNEEYLRILLSSKLENAPHCTLLSAGKPFSHLLAVCVLVNSTCVIISWLSQWCERGLAPVNKIVLGHVPRAFSASHHYGIGTGLDCAVAIPMSHCKRSLVGRRAVHWDPFGGA